MIAIPPGSWLKAVQDLVATKPTLVQCHSQTNHLYSVNWETKQIPGL